MKKIIKGDIVMESLHLTELVDLSNVEVTGMFSCRDNSITSLEGAPKVVHHGFDCSYNKLQNLIGAPKVVHRGFDCSYNKLQNLIGAPKRIYGDFNCCNNPLISLKGLPKEIGTYLRISHELKTEFSEKYIHSICNVGIIIWTHNDGLIRA